jgi:hypothetical protein
LTKDLITPVMRIQIELALAAMRDDLDSLRSLEIEAKRMALTAAEIDAAKRGASFDAIINIAVKFALAVCADDVAGMAVTKQKLAALGVAIAPELYAFVQGLKPPTSE